MEMFKCIFHPMTLCGSGLRRVSSCFVLVVSFLIALGSSSAFAVDYYWFSAVSGGSGPSPQAACATIAPGTFDVATASMNGPDSATCHLSQSWSTGHRDYDVVVRRGDACPAGSTYNPAKGTCDIDDKCSILKGTVIQKFKYTSATDSPPSTISINGCAASISGWGICLNTTKGNYSCTGTATITGDKLDPAAGSQSGECQGDACTAGQPTNESKSDPCAAVPAGTGFTCSATKSDSNPGTTKCGTVNDAWICTENPKSTSSDSKSDISQTVQQNADGSTTTKTTTVTTVTGCTGVGNCTTGTTTTVVTGGTNSNGTNKPDSSSCSGPGCNGGSGSGSGPGSPGTGGGSDKPTQDPPVETVSGDMACTAVVACEGDVIQCAILRQEQQSRCADEKFRDMSQPRIDEMKTALDTEFSGADYQPLKPKDENTFDISKMIDTTGFLGRTCPRLPILSASYGRFPMSVDLNQPWLCTFLTLMGYLNVAFALRRAAMIIGEGV